MTKMWDSSGSVPFFHIQRQVICAVVEFDLNLRD